ncbi:MAG: Gfo/Idh/MocA family oxidoreductase [Candidatus Synoicihabitans palmerolidicus]|nr:Gfo/Idh/MocA family oxidoreductase [Candidatus Synoicihabitans palmerolidicus]
MNAHVPGWQSLPDVEIVAVADVRETAARGFVAATGGRVQVFSDYKEMLKLDLDAVDICTPNMVHTPAVIAAWKAGKHVLCEKPLATSTKDIRKMGELADSLGLTLMSCQHMR